MRAKRAMALLLVALPAPGCYLGHLARGQACLLRSRQPIDAVLADPATPEVLRGQLGLVQQTRRFARELGLEVGGQYTSYAPWPGDRVVTIVTTTRPGELEPAGFAFPLVGRVPYKGFFDRERAAAEVRRQRARGFDVCETGVAAYSSLGWFDDPVTGPMLRGGDGALVDTILHELVHATVYVPDHARFNEGVASFLGEEGSVLFYEEAGDPERAHSQRRRVQDDRLVRAELSRLREEIEALYRERPDPGSARDEARAEREARARARIAALPLAAGGAAELAAGLPLNDACLALAGTYGGDVERYASALARSGGDLRAFVGRVREAAREPDPREALLAD